MASKKWRKGLNVATALQEITKGGYSGLDESLVDDAADPPTGSRGHFGLDEKLAEGAVSPPEIPSRPNNYYPPVGYPQNGGYPQIGGQVPGVSAYQSPPLTQLPGSPNLSGGFPSAQPYPPQNS